jgi:hypothetical protein
MTAEEEIIAAVVGVGLVALVVWKLTSSSSTAVVTSSSTAPTAPTGSTTVASGPTTTGFSIDLLPGHQTFNVTSGVTSPSFAIPTGATWVSLVANDGSSVNVAGATAAQSLTLTSMAEVVTAIYTDAAGATQTAVVTVNQG